MEIRSITPAVHTNFRSVEQVKRSEPTTLTTESPLIENRVEKENLRSKFKYNWKTISAITGAGALILVGILKRNAISDMLGKFINRKIPPAV